MKAANVKRCNRRKEQRGGNQQDSASVIPSNQTDVGESAEEIQPNPHVRRRTKRGKKKARRPVLSSSSASDNKDDSDEHDNDIGDDYNDDSDNNNGDDIEEDNTVFPGAVWNRRGQEYTSPPPNELDEDNVTILVNSDIADTTTTATTATTTATTSDNTNLNRRYAPREQDTTTASRILSAYCPTPEEEAKEAWMIQRIAELQSHNQEQEPQQQLQQRNNQDEGLYQHNIEIYHAEEVVLPNNVDGYSSNNASNDAKRRKAISPTLWSDRMVGDLFYYQLATIGFAIIIVVVVILICLFIFFLPTTGATKAGKPPISMNITTSSSPTPPATLSPTVDMWGLISNIITSNTLTRQDSLRDPTSSQFQALQWLIHNDSYFQSSYIPYLDYQGIEANNNTTPSLQEILERYALLVIFHATNGKDWWGHNRGWLSDQHVCHGWGGIQCLEANHTNSSNNEDAYNSNAAARSSPLMIVTELDLHEYGLHGSIPPEIGILSHLTNLNLRAYETNIKPEHRRKLSGTIPTQLSYLTSLKALNISTNQFSSTLPSEIGLIKTLESLEIGGSDLTGTIPVEFWSSLPNLQMLTLWGNQFTGILPTEIGSILSSQLTRLELDHNLLQGSIPTQFGRLTKLQHVYLNVNKFTSTLPSEIGLLSDLKEMILFGNSLEGNIPSEFSNLHNLVDLQLHDNNFVGNLTPIFCNSDNTTEIDNETFPNLGSGEDWWSLGLISDCEGGPPTSPVQCDCCTECYTKWPF